MALRSGQERLRVVGFVVILLAGFAGSFHCVGMCGGFACGLGTDPSGSARRTAVRHVLYNSGRVVTYMFIGALAGLLGSALVGGGMVHGVGHAMESGQDGMTMPVDHAATGLYLAGELGGLQRVLSVVAGGFMLMMSLQLFGVLRHSRRSWLGVGGKWLSSALGSVLRSPSPTAPVALGVINGFLPCPLVYAFAALAAATGSVMAGIGTMAALGLGTFPAMLLMGLVGRMLSPVVRRRGVRLAGCLVLIIAAVTIVRGGAPWLLHFDRHSL